MEMQRKIFGTMSHFAILVCLPPNDADAKCGMEPVKKITKKLKKTRKNACIFARLIVS